MMHMCMAGGCILGVVCPILNVLRALMLVLLHICQLVSTCQLCHIAYMHITGWAQLPLKENKRHGQLVHVTHRCVEDAEEEEEDAEAEEEEEEEVGS